MSSNLNNFTNLNIQNERKIKKLDLDSIAKANAFKTPCITSKKSEYNSKDNLENNKNDCITSEQDVFNNFY